MKIDKNIDTLSNQSVDITYGLFIIIINSLLSRIIVMQITYLP